MEVAIYLVIGVVLGLAVGFFAARSRSQAFVQTEVQDALKKLEDETIEKTRRKVTKELREELGTEVREELVEKLGAEVRSEAEAEAKKLVEAGKSEAETLTKDAELEAKSIVLAAQKEAEQELKERRGELQKLEERLITRETNLDTRASRLDEREVEARERDEKSLEAEKALVHREVGLKEKEGEIAKALEKVAGYTMEEAKAELIERMVGEASLEAGRKIREMEEEMLEQADRKAQEVISVAVQRYAGDYVAEKCVSVVTLPSDDMKGRIIGREGRNIRALEAATGVDIIIDDTPEAVIVSGFDPVRRQIARISLEKLIADGRIHPSRIEEIVEKTDQEVAQSIKEAGEQAAFELGIHGLHPELIKVVGRLKYRTSYGQNMWSHSIEVGFLCGLMASELGVNVKFARRAGLLHDIGKAFTHEQEGSHALIGADLCKKYGENEIVRNAVAAH
ncbi:MAG: ribonuclease Y, partial [Bradymonadaceae bacterium]